MVLTLGTGLGAALSPAGIWCRTSSSATTPSRKSLTYEQRVGEAELDRVGKQRWSRRVGRMLDQLAAPIFNYDVLYLGGGNAKKLQLDLPENVVRFENMQGLRGGIRLWDNR